ncbi:phosphoglucosamine mutase [bacterium]|nr:phosphoglucosamine mutase [bacterium]
MQKLFGTDGIRGRAGDKLTPELALRAAFGLAQILATDRQRYRSNQRPVFAVAGDSRLSTTTLKSAVISGITYGGCDVLDLGIVPTPLVPLLVISQGCLGGVMITASHNPVPDNGLKFFNRQGYKLDPTAETALERFIFSGELPAVEQRNFGQVEQYDASAFYRSFAVKTLGRTKPQRKLRVVLDCACGATAELAPLVFTHLGFKVVPINDRFDGNRVNVNCGATNLKGLARRVRREKADLGLAFDGDGDRIKAVDENGKEVSGDKIIALFATQLSRYRRQKAAVMTHMTNMGVELALRELGIRLVRTEVGDIKVLAEMKRQKLDLGGEQSGHIILRDKVPTGDGILVGTQLAALAARTKQPLSQLVAGFPEYPQQLTNLSVSDKEAWRKSKSLLGRLAAIEREYRDVRFYLRPSGTEDVVRILTEAQDRARCQAANAAVCRAFGDWDKGRK